MGGGGGRGEAKGDGCQLQLGTTHILINAIHWLHRPCGAPSWFDRLEKSHL